MDFSNRLMSTITRKNPAETCDINLNWRVHLKARVFLPFPEWDNNFPHRFSHECDKRYWSNYITIGCSTWIDRLLFRYGNHREELLNRQSWLGGKSHISSCYPCFPLLCPLANIYEPPIIMSQNRHIIEKSKTINTKATNAPHTAPVMKNSYSWIVFLMSIIYTPIIMSSCSS